MTVAHHRDQGAELSGDELRIRIALAKSVLGHAPLYRAVRKALAALDGASIAELAAAEDEPREPPRGEQREYLRGWHDGWDAGYAAGTDRRAGVVA